MPLGLLEGFARTWASLAGGAAETLETPWGPLVMWVGPDGQREALPDRMYGLAAEPGSDVDPDAMPAGVTVHLPPGVTARGGEEHCLGHHLEASGRDEAWSALRRVGRQGVTKARKAGCRGASVDDGDYLRLAMQKAAALAGRPPHPELTTALRREFGHEAVRLTGVEHGTEVVACVLSVRVGDYVMLADGASDRRHWDKNPNNLAVWEAVAGWVDQGCRHIDYGFSPMGAGDAQFKDHMGGRAVILQKIVGLSNPTP